MEQVKVMAPFRFSLEQVLRYRSQLEQMAQVELARVERERIRERVRADAIREILGEQEESLAGFAPDKRGERWLTENFIRGLRTDLGVALQRVRNWTMAAEAARRELVVRSRDRKILEKLKATQAENHAKEEKLREQREFDEIASLRRKTPH